MVVVLESESGKLISDDRTQFASFAPAYLARRGRGPAALLALQPARVSCPCRQFADNLLATYVGTHTEVLLMICSKRQPS